MQIPISGVIMFMAMTVIATLVISHIVKETKEKKDLDIPYPVIKTICVAAAVGFVAEIILLASF